MPDTNSDAVKLLSDDALREVESKYARAESIVEDFYQDEYAVAASLNDIPALCATVRALRKQVGERESHRRGFIELFETAEARVTDLEAENTALRELLGQLLQSQESTLDHNRSLIAELAQVTQEREVSGKRIAVLHSIGISGIGGSINDFWERLLAVSGEKRAAFCQALHQLCEITGHNNENRCLLCEKMGARNVQGYYMGDRFFDGTKKDYRH